MLKHIKYVFAAAMALLLTGCTDDVLWRGDVDNETEIVIPFRESALTDVSASTRAFSSVSTNVTHLSLLVYNTSGNYQTLTKSEFDVSSSSTDPDVVTDANGQKGIKIKRSEVCAGHWYLVANAEAQVENFLKGSHSENDFISHPISRAVVLGSNSDGSGVGNAIMTGMIDVAAVPASGTSTLPTVNLRRLFSWIIFKVDNACKDFLVTGVRLYMEPTTVDLYGSPSSTVTDGRGYISTPLNGAVTGTTIKYLKPGDKFQMYTLPISGEMEEKTESGKMYYKEARLLIKGRYCSGHDEQNNNAPIFDNNSEECFYSYAFPGDIAANHQITLTLKAVASIGASTEEKALSEPSTVVVKYEDKEDDINNIVSDGEHVIALPDTIYADPEAKTYNFNVIWRAKNGEDIAITNVSEANNTGWLTLAGNGGTTTIAASSAETNQGLLRKNTPYKVTLTENLGSEREFTLKYTIKDSDKNYLDANLVIVQKAPENINLDNDLNVKLTISGAYSATIDNYLIFVGNNPDAGTKLKGINPSENGGRIRNAGLHMPMPNGGSTKYKYEIWADNSSQTWTIQNNWSGKVSITGNGTSGNHWVIEFNDNNNLIGDPAKSGNEKLWEYVVAEDALEFSNGTKTLTLDLYHTGLFHKVGNDYYYYEAFKAGNQIWLDRNIGATSAGMAHYMDTYVRGSWPMSVASAGNMYTFTEASTANASMIPKGWRLPSQGDFEAMTMQGNFSSNRMTAGGETFFAPTYRMPVTTVKKDGTRRGSNINSYFPHNRTRKSDGKISGDAGAGYYWTSTGTSSASYKRVMKFAGQNVSAADFMYGSESNGSVTDLGNKMSLRCVAGDNNNTAYTYSCQVKGYTHAFLYYQDENGAKTYLNTWPGTEIAVGDMAERKYCPFKYESYVNYATISTSTGTGKGLYVIFNNPGKSSTDEDYSNVTAAARKDRKGVPFMTGKAYDINLIGSDKLVYPNSTKDYVVAGNWTTTPVTNTKDVVVTFRAPKNSSDEKIKDYLYLWSNNGDNITGSWPGSKNDGEEDNYYYWTRTITLEKTQTPDDIIKGYLFTDGDNAGSTDDILWSYNRHKEVLDAATKEKFGNCDYLYTIWATGSTEPTPTSKKYLVIRVNENDIYPNQEYLYAWTSSSDEPFGDYHSAPFITGRIDGYKYWRVESSITNLEGVILKTSMSGEGDTGRKKEFKSWTTETNATLKEKYNATTLLTINASSYITGNYSGKYINVLGDFNEWKDNGAVPEKNGATVHEVAIGNGAFKVKVWDGSETWYSTGGAIQQNTWIDLSSKEESNNMSISGAQSGQTFRVEFDYNKKLIRVTPK